jgi:hypothetical protein
LNHEIGKHTQSTHTLEDALSFGIKISPTRRKIKSISAPVARIFDENKATLPGVFGQGSTRLDHPQRIVDFGMSRERPRAQAVGN